MIRTSSLYEACRELFASHPLATSTTNRGEHNLHSMVLLSRDGDDAQFFVLSQDSDEYQLYSLHRWPAGDAVRIEADGMTSVPSDVVHAVTHGVPIPRDGSLFGWVSRGVVTALIAVYATYTPQSPQPVWTVMPLAESPEDRWPPFTDEHFFGDWFWEHHSAGRVILLDNLIAGTCEVVFWVDTRAILGADSCAVAHDVKSPKGYMLQHGRYVYYETLRSGKPVPPLPALLASPTKIDLAPRLL